eukprot:TRINITY_DN8740_c0_g1_i1.p1 TRINITY_DN8740_c0_g1~~TRINITY_DN8740_c0_g1_i1.p1  ORF type:complete len:325 (-),score=47.61 TRINITY_DN8740_c0_g1_i1:561-1436(-)
MPSKSSKKNTKETLIEPKSDTVSETSGSNEYTSGDAVIGSVKLDIQEKGSSTTGKKYTSIDDMWKQELSDYNEDNLKEVSWYKNADEYWKQIDATVDGMLGGYERISIEDLKGSREFLKEFLDGKHGFTLGKGRAIDCGAGIGRIAKGLIVPIFQQTDLLELNPTFLAKAKEFINSEKVKNYFCSGLHQFDFGDNKYDLIWIQWVIGYLTDAHLVDFLQRCQKALTNNGVIIVKDNNCSEGFIVDKTDSSVTRSDNYFKALIKQTGLSLVKVKLQARFPTEIFPVRMYALR